jgi:glutamate-1-semialdehyde 2,1-aminomutase
MEVIDPSEGKVSFGGTYNGSQMVVAAASAALEKLGGGHVQNYLHHITGKLVEGFNRICEQKKIIGRMQGFAGKFQTYFIPHQVFDWRSASSANTQMYSIFRNQMVERGIFWSPAPFTHHGLTAAHTEQDIDIILKAAEESLEKIAEEF